MTSFEKCCMIAYICDSDGEALVDEDGDPIVYDIDLQNPYDFVAGQVGITDMEIPDGGHIMCPDDWPQPSYPECICGDYVFGDDHYVLQWGDQDDCVEEEDWAEWQCALHAGCLSTFFEYIRGAEEFGVWDREEWYMHRDTPPNYMYTPTHRRA